MKVKKSREYPQDDGSKVSFTFDRADGKIVGIKKDGASVSPNTIEFADLSQGSEALAAYNVAKYGAAKKSYVRNSPASKTSAELNSYYINESKKEANEQKIAEQTAIIDEAVATFQNYKDTGVGNSSEMLAYPFNFDTSQDHLKITRHE